MKKLKVKEAFWFCFCFKFIPHPSSFIPHFVTCLTDKIGLKYLWVIYPTDRIKMNNYS